MSKDFKYELSVMFITYNRKPELLRALKSCVRYRIDSMEIVIVDNHSEDGTQEAVQTYLQSVNMPFEYDYSDVNLGVSAGRNKAFELCSGRYVLCLDDDAVLVSEGFFQKMIEQMDRNPDAVSASFTIFEPQNDRYLDGLRYQQEGQTYGFSYIGAAHVLSADFFQDRPLYPNTLKFGSEELYIAYRIWKNGKRMLHLDDLVVHHLPSVVARVYGRDRALAIIVNNYVIRKLCYPRLILPFLSLTFLLHLAKHNAINREDLASINQMIRERYDSSFLDRMNLHSFFRMLQALGPKGVF